jgi:hypothetical protein
MGSATYGRVADDMEKLPKRVLVLIYRLEHYKNANVPKIGHLKLIHWWYLCSAFYGSSQKMLGEQVYSYSYSN